MASPPRDVWRPLLFCGIFQAVGWLGLTFLSLGHHGFAYEVDNDLTPTGAYFAIQAFLWFILVVTFFWIRRGQSSKAAVIFVMGVSISLRLIAIAGQPIHESDFYRYLWDGKISQHRINPYRFEPGALYLEEKHIETAFKDQSTGVTWRGRHFSEEEKQILSQLRILRDENPLLFERVSHPAVTTIYPPAAQWIFWFSQICFGDSIMGMKTIFALFDIGVAALIVLILRQVGRPTHWAILYAWNPLPIKEFANSSHYDSAAIFLMLLAVWFALLRWPPIRKTLLVSLTLALGTLTKYFAILLLPILLVYIARQTRCPDDRSLPGRFFLTARSPLIWFGFGSYMVATGLGFAPYVLWNHAGATEVFRGLATYQQHWQYSPGLFALLERGIALFTPGSFSIAKTVAALLLSGTVLVEALVSRRDLCGKCFVVMAALFVLSPTAFPWYFCWVLAFVPFQDRLSWLVLGLLLPLNYFDFHSPGDLPFANVRWAGFYATQILSWGIFLVTWIGESIHRHFV